MLSSNASVKSNSRLVQSKTVGPKEASELQVVLEEEFIFDFGAG